MARGRERLTDEIIAKLPAPKHGNRVHYDAPNRKGNDYVPGFGVRVTAGGARAFILNYRTKAGRERRYTIGAPPVWNVTAARAEAKTLKHRIGLGEDPMGAVRAGRDAPTVADLCDRIVDEFLPKKRPSTQETYTAMIDRYIKPDLGAMKAAAVTYADIDRLHRKVTKAGNPYRANRVVALLSKMFALAIRWHMRTDNPAKGIERNQEHKRERYLSAAELARLSHVLAAHTDQQAANVIRVLLLTGARSGEVMAARWDQFDLEAGVWTKPGTTTKQKTLHRVPLSGPARLLLARLYEEAPIKAEFVFPGRGSPHRVDLKKAWPKFCAAAKISGARVHDLRHTYASVLASAGQSLPIIGALLGHTQPITTARYAHLLDDPLRKATERASTIIGGKQRAAGVVPLRNRRP